MHIVALDPWLGGSHARLLAQWQAVSRHTITVLGLPARHWKWRQAAGAYALAKRCAQTLQQPPDVLWVSDFVDVPQLRAFLPRGFERIPLLVYFHENQLTYPRSSDEAFLPDLGPAWSNLVSALAADLVVFNSFSHREQLLQATRSLLERLPRPKPKTELLAALEGAQVVYPGIDWQGIPLGPTPAAGGPLRVLFPHRWEHDKDPVEFLRLVCRAEALGAKLELHLIGEHSNSPPAGCIPFLERLRSRIATQGPIAALEAYRSKLGECDLVVSTAHHETYGMAVLEACAAGCTPLVPARLAYPETLTSRSWGFAPYADSNEALAHLVQAGTNPAMLRTHQHREQMRIGAQPQDFKITLAEMDRLVEGLARG